jgi:DNA polymerase III delta prime subunit
MRQISRRTVLIFIAGTILYLLLLLLDVLKGAFASIFPHLPLWILLVSIVVFIILATAFGLWQEKLKSTPSMPEAVARENRQIMLGRVQTKWITGFLENPLYYNELLSLALRARTSRSGSQLQNPLDQAHALPPGTTIKEIFDDARGRLLILGEAGTGKTTLLLELARDLLQQAKNNEDAPIPIVLTLASWAVKQAPLKQWVVEELRTKYDISPQVGEVWFEMSQLLLLLDGFDEVAPSAQPACIEAVSAYAAQANRYLVVCSRTKEYLDQPGRFSSLHNIVSIQPLSPQHIEDYLSTWGEDGSRLKRSLHQSEALRALVVTPLLLKVLSLAYLDKSEQEVLTLVETTPADQLHRLFHDYVEQMLRRVGARVHATAQQTKNWLAWLARQLTAHQQSEFYLDLLQPDWLPKGQRAFYRLGFGLAVGLVFGLVYGLAGGLLFGLIGLVYGLAGGLLFGLIGLVYGRNPKIEPVEALTWSWNGLVYGLVGGLVVGLLFGRAGGLVGGLVVGLLFGLTYGLVFGLLFGLLFGTSTEQLTEVSILSPNEGIRRSVKNGLVVGLVFGLVFGLAGGLGFGLVFGLVYGLASGLVGGLIGLVFGLAYGLGAAVRHFTLRFWLWRTRLFPWQAVPFLEDTVEQLLLHKVGGGYIFRHRLLQDYFSSLDTPPFEEAPIVSASLQKPDEKG